MSRKTGGKGSSKPTDEELGPEVVESRRLQEKAFDLGVSSPAACVWRSTSSQPIAPAVGYCQRRSHTVDPLLPACRSCHTRGGCAPPACLRQRVRGRCVRGGGVSCLRSSGLLAGRRLSPTWPMNVLLRLHA